MASGWNKWLKLAYLGREEKRGRLTKWFSKDLLNPVVLGFLSLYKMQNLNLTTAAYKQMENF